MRRILSTLLCASLAAAAAPTLAHAQDDWEVTRDPFDKSVIARLKGILARNPNDADALAKLLGMYRRYRSVKLLREEYDAALAKKPDDWSTLVILARLARSEGDAAAALGFFERAAAGKKDAAVQVELGTIYRTSGKLTEARAAFDAALAASPSKPVKMKALRALADLALAGKDIDGARAYFDQYIALEPGNVGLRLELGDALAAAGKYDDAIAVYLDAEKRLSSDPARRVEVVARIGQAQAGKGADDEAVASYRRAIKLVPRGYYLEVELTARIVDIYRGKQALADLLAYYEKEWPAGGRGHFEWDTLARLYEETGDQEKAVVAYQKAVAKAPYELETQRRLIQLLEAVGRDKDALAQYEVVVAVAPGEARFQIELADRYMKALDEAKALATVKKMEARFPGDAGVQSAIADMYLRWGKDDLALAALERLAKLEPDDPDHLVTLGEQYHQRGEVDRAMATWKRIAATKSAIAYARLGDVLAEHDAPTEGLVYYAKAIKMEPANPELYKGRAVIFERQRAFADAMADWEKALSLWVKPSDRSARREARTRIVNLLPRWDQGTHKEAYRARWESAFGGARPDLDAGYFLVAYYQRFAQQNQPRATLERILELAPDDQESLFDLVKAYRAERDYDKATERLLGLAAKDPTRQREAYTLLAEIETERHRDQQAIEYSLMALEKSPSDPVAYTRLAELYIDMQRLDDAIAAYTRSIELDRRNWKAYFALAAIHQQRAEHDQAAELYRRILRQATDDDTLTKAGRAAIALEEINQSLGELEKVLAPLSSILSHKPVYRRLLVELYVRYVPRLVARSRRGSSEVRSAARLELERLGHGGMKPLLDALGDDKDPAQRAVAVAVLGHLGNKAAAAPLVKVARQEPRPIDPGAPRQLGTLTSSLDLESRIAALVAAGRLGDARIVGDLLPLAKHAEVGLREAAVFALARIRDPRAAAALVEALADHRPSVAALACAGLASSGDARSVAAAITALGERTRPDLVRAACAAGLAGAGATAQAGLIAAVGDNAGETQRIAAWALGHQGDRKALPALLGAYLARIGQDRGTITWAIGRVAGEPPRPLPDLGEYPMRAGKLDLAAMIRGVPGELPGAAPPADVLVGQDKLVARAIADALGGHRDAVLSVLSDLDARDDGLALGELTAGPMSPAGAQALAAIGAAVVGDVVAHAGDPDPKVAARALSVAGKIGGPVAAAALGPALTDERRLVRAAAMHAIGRAGARAGAPLVASLTAMLRAPDWQDRMEAAAAIGRLGPAADVAALAAAAGDADNFVRSAVATALGATRSPAAVEALTKLAADPIAEVRAAAEAALADPKRVP